MPARVSPIRPEKRLLMAAEKLICHQGTQFQIRDLYKEASCAPNALYQHFFTITRLVNAVFAHGWNCVVDEIVKLGLATLPQTPAEILYLQFEAMFNALEKNPEAVGAFLVLANSSDSGILAETKSAGLLSYDWFVRLVEELLGKQNEPAEAREAAIGLIGGAGWLLVRRTPLYAPTNGAMASREVSLRTIRQTIEVFTGPRQLQLP